ncbi:MAG TPA: SAM-dependent methyltransferase [Streptosporangiaceae bacterium]
MDTSQAHMARVYDYWLGGKDNFAADRAAGDAVIQAYPGVIATVRANRALLARMVRYLAGEAGIVQFLDIGTGIPSANNTHEVAQSVTPSARVVYVDNDPIVLVHARALLVSNPLGATSYLEADLRDLEPILDQAAQLLDLSQPVAVMLMGVMHLISDEDDPSGIVARLMSAVSPGSYLAMSHPAADIDADAMADAQQRQNQAQAEPVTFRRRDQVERFFDGLEMVEPGLVRAPEWRPDLLAGANPGAALWAGLGQKA